MPHTPGLRPVVRDFIHGSAGVKFNAARSRTFGIPPGVQVLTETGLIPARGRYSGRHA